MNKKITFLFLVTTVLFTIIPFYLIPSTFCQENYVVIEPAEPATAGIAPYAVTPGQLVMVNVTIKNAVNIYGYNLSFSLSNPSILKYVDHLFWPFLEEPYTSNIYVVGGRFTVYAKSQPPAGPVSGSSVLVTLIFNATSIGETLITFDALNCWLIMQDGTQIHPSTFKRGKLAVTNTKLAVEPATLTGQVNETVKANITVYNVQNLYGIEFNITWDPTVLTPIKVHYQTPWTKENPLRNVTTTGEYALAVTAMYPAQPYSGNHTFVNMEFKILKTGLTQITIKYSKLGDSKSKAITHAKVNAIFSNIKTAISFTPSITVDANLTTGKSFNTTILLSDVVNLKSFHIKISYPDFINFTRAIFNETLLFSDNGTIHDPVTRVVTIYGEFITANIGNLSLVTLEFNVIGYGSGNLFVKEAESSLRDNEGNPLLFKTSKSLIVNWHNVRISQFDLVGLMIGKKYVIGGDVSVSVTVENLGAADENVTLTIAYVGNITINGTSTIVKGVLFNGSLWVEKYGGAQPSNNKTIIWNTANLTDGIYQVTANVSIEVDHFPVDNMASKSIEFIYMPVDIAVSNVYVMPEEINVNQNVSVIVVLQNLGKLTESFNMTVFLEGNPIREFTNLVLEGGAGNWVIFTLSFSNAGKYTLNCTVSDLPLESNLKNNYFVKVLQVGRVSSLLTFETAVILTVAIIAVLVSALLYCRRRRR